MDWPILSGIILRVCRFIVQLEKVGPIVSSLKPSLISIAKDQTTGNSFNVKCHHFKNIKLTGPLFQFAAQIDVKTSLSFLQR